MSLDRICYVPAIKWRMGEFGALEELSPEEKSAITPLVEIPPIPWDFAGEQPAKSIDDHLSRVPSQMVRCWGGEAAIFVDLALLDSVTAMADGQHPVDDLFGRLAAEPVQAVPVIGPGRDADYEAAIACVAARDHRGCCFRVGLEDAFGPGLAATLDQLADAVGVGRPETDLIIDLGAIEASQLNLLRIAVTGLLAELPGVDDYRTVTVLSGAFPVDLSAVSPGVGLLPRADWALWLSILAASPKRAPVYGDYTAAHPEPQEIDPRLMRVSASIRYAAMEDWLILRGRSVNDARFGGFQQFQQLSRQATGHHLFGSDVPSWADGYIQACAAGEHTGNLTNWRKVATNRHIVLTLHQTAIFS